MDTMTKGSSIFQDQSDADVSAEVGDEHKYIIFRLGKELYGVRLLEVREVVETMPTISVPNTVTSFQGVCNLRGQIIGVVDLRSRFDITSSIAERPVLVVFETESGAIAAAVDQIVSVSIIAPTDVETKPNIVSSIPVKYIIGIGKLDKRLVTIVNLHLILSQEELVRVENSKLLLKAG
jgi:purine-binding chemotaxis protein CheW